MSTKYILFNAIAVAREVTVSANDPVARDDD